MKIDKEFVTRIADLSMLIIEEDDILGYVKDMSDILRYMDQLTEVDVNGVDPTNHVTDLHSVFREDMVRDYPSEKRKNLLAEVPVMEDGYVVVPKTV